VIVGIADCRDCAVPDLSTLSAVGRNRFIAPFLVDLIDGSLPSRRRNKAIAPYGRWSRA
jgi:hypothetical protein